MESIVWNNSFEQENDCWKLTTFCRDILATPKMDELGHGGTPADLEGITPLAMTLALASGLLASLMVLFAMRGGCSKKQDEEYGDVQFSQVDTHDIT